MNGERDTANEGQRDGTRPREVEIGEVRDALDVLERYVQQRPMGVASSARGVVVDLLLTLRNRMQILDAEPPGAEGSS